MVVTGSWSTTRGGFLLLAWGGSGSKHRGCGGVASYEPGRAGDFGGLDARVLGWLEKEEQDEAEQKTGTHAVARHVRLFRSWQHVLLLRILYQIRRGPGGVTDSFDSQQGGALQATSKPISVGVKHADVAAHLRRQHQRFCTEWPPK